MREGPLIRICYVSYEYPPQFGGGIGTYIYNIARALVRRGHEVTVITFNPGGLPAFEEQEGVRVFRVGFGERDHVLLGQAVPDAHTLVYWRRYSQRIYNLLKTIQHTIDVVEWPDYRCEGEAAMLAKRTRGEFARIPFVVRLHTPLFVLDEYNRPKASMAGRLTEAFEKMYLQTADYICSPTSILAKIVAKTLNWPGEIAILPHPLDFAAFPQEAAYRDSSTILYVGRLERRKGVETLVRAILPLLQKYEGITLKLIGSDTFTSPDGTSMQAYLKGMIPGNLTGRIDFTGSSPREQLLAEYARARFCVFPSLFENFPNVCLEAMASGVPVLVSDNSGMVDMVSDGLSGYVFKAGNVDDLRAKLKKMINLPYERLRAMAAQAHMEVREKYGIAVTVRKQEQYFTEITEGIERNETGHEGRRDYVKGLASVVVPCGGEDDFLRETMESIQAQSYLQIELIIVNGSSTAPKITKNVKLIESSRQDMTSACNEGVKQASGEYILILNPGDVLDMQFVATAANILSGKLEIGFVYSWVKYHDDYDGVWETPDYHRDLLLSQEICSGSSLFRHAAFDLVGGFQSNTSGEPGYWSFWLSLASLGWAGKCIREALITCRRQESDIPGGTMLLHLPERETIERHRDVYEANLPSVLSHARAENGRLAARLTYVEQQVEQLKQQIISLEQIVETRGLEISNLKQDRDNLHQTLVEIYNSKAWKLVTRYRNARDVMRFRK